MNKVNTSSSKWFAVATVIAVICVACGIFYYYNFFRQNNANLIESVPDDAVFIFKINNPEPFVKNSTKLSPYMNELFFMGTFAGFHSFLDKVPSQNDKNNTGIVISAHNTGDKLTLLHSAKMTSHNFDKLLKILQIDSRNCIVFENSNIYQFGTHYHKFYFVWHHNIFSSSESLDLLKKTIKQHKQVKNLTFDKDFKEIYEIVAKNDKQNWLLLDYNQYLTFIKNNLHEKFGNIETDINSHKWAAFQVRLTENEIKLAGYLQTPAQLSDNKDFNSTLPNQIIPQNCDFCVMSEAQICKFIVSHDSVSYDYIAEMLDTAANTFERLLPEGVTEDSAVKFKNRLIFPANIFFLAPEDDRFYSYTTHILQQDNFAVSSDTLPALKYYISRMNQMETLEDNPLYRFANQNLPSQFIYKELYFFNTEFVRGRVFKKENTLPQTAAKISMFGISLSENKNGFIPSNIYIRF